LNFFVEPFADFAILTVHVIECHLELFFVLVELTDLVVEPFFFLIDELLVLRAHLSYQHLVVGFAAVLQQDWVNFPYGGQESVLVFRMVECLVQHFVEADRVDEEASVDTVDAGNLNIHTVKKQPVDRVALKGQFLRGFQYDSRDIKMFSICQCLIDPGLDYARI